MKIYTVVGARPNFIKIDPKLKQDIIHTGQHYDDNMSKIFFRELGIKKPKYNLKCRGNKVGEMIDKLRILFFNYKPDLVLVFGDTYSSLAGALAAKYEHIKVAHVEAGVRSFTDIPEETNRVIIDHIADVRMCPDERSLIYLESEGLKENNYVVGDPLIDTMNRFCPIKPSKNKGKYILVTLHRASNDKAFYKEVFKVLKDTEEQYIFPAHPNTRRMLKMIPKNVKVIKPVGYKEMLSLQANAKKVITDSGGIQRESAWLNIPVIVLRDTTEWIDLVNKKQIKLSDVKELKNDIENFNRTPVAPPEYGVNKKIREILARHI